MPVLCDGGLERDGRVALTACTLSTRRALAERPTPLTWRVYLVAGSRVMRASPCVRARPGCRQGEAGAGRPPELCMSAIKTAESH